MPIYALRIDNKKKKELDRLRDLNNGLEMLLETPIKKVREFVESQRRNKNI